MPHSFLLRRLTYTLLSAVDSFTNLLLSCESPSPRTPRSPRSPRSPRPNRRKRPLLSTPDSPTSVKPNPQTTPLFDSQPPLRRSRTRHHQPHSRNFRNFSHDNLVHARLTRRNSLPANVRQHTYRHAQRQQKRTRVPAKHPHPHPHPHPNYHRHRDRIAFVDPPASIPPSAAPDACRRNRDSVNADRKCVQPDPPVAPIALPPTVRNLPRGTLTSFLTSDDTPIFPFKPLEDGIVKDPLLEQGIRPSRRVRFAQNVQLVC